MNIEIEIIPVEHFEVKANGKTLGMFEKVSSWEGMIKLKRNDGVIIVSDENSIIDKIYDVFLQKEKQSSFSVVKISPSLLDKCI